jgi:L-lactate utilization protein LutC
MIAQKRSDSQLEKEAAKAVKKTGKNSPSASPNAEWSESKVASLRAYEYEQYEEEILKAMQSGKFVYDMSGAAR